MNVDLAKLKTIVTGAFVPDIPLDQCETPLLAVPKDYDLKDLTEFLRHPVRIADKYHLSKVESLIHYVRRFDASASIAFLNLAERSLAVILDFHTRARASHCSHRVLFKPYESVELTGWKALLGKPWKLEQFGELVEDRLEDFDTPASAELLDLVNNFYATSSQTVRQTGVLKNGNRSLTFNESADALEFPRQLLLAIPLWRGTAKRTVKILLRLKIVQAVPSIILTAPGLERQLQEEFEAAAATFASETKIELLHE